MITMVKVIVPICGVHNLVYVLQFYLMNCNIHYLSVLFIDICLLSLTHQ